MWHRLQIVLALGVLALGPADRAFAQSDPFQAVRPTAPPAPAPAARPAAPEASRSAPAPQGLRVAPPGGVDGVWSGRITCDPIGESRALNVAFTLTVTGGSARYERRIFDPRNSQWLGDYERGTGRIGPDGSVILNGQAVGQGSAAGNRGSMTYSGRMSGSTMSLSGHQNWSNATGGQSAPRPCTINLSRG